MKIAIEGCAHGELQIIYDTISSLEKKENTKIDLLLCCGDFQTSRNIEDLICMAVPQKYNNICSFYKYYSGEKLAPILTILIGGNHEASNYLQELPFGGWVAPKIYYLGYAGVINIAGVRIAGLSGIYKANDYMKGHFEVFPFDDNTKRSVYHIRNSEVFRLKQISQPLDIMLSHDWPTNVTDYGNKEQLIRFKPHFKEDIENQKLGSKPCEELMSILKPKYWFSAHLHCKFAALIPHENNTFTRFLALDKCLPKRRFLQVIEIPHDENQEIRINYDLEWLTILVTTNHLTSVKQVPNYLPGLHGNERFSFTPTIEEKSVVMSKLTNDLTIPENFKQTVEAYDDKTPKKHNLRHIGPIQNSQTVHLCELLSIDDPIELILKEKGRSFDESYTQLQNDISSINIKNDASLENPCDASFINDTIAEETTPLKDSKRKLSSISLPKPKNEIQDIFVIDKDPSTTSNNSFECLNRDNSFLQVDKEDSNKFMKREIENTEQLSKSKMKRRNTESYVN